MSDEDYLKQNRLEPNQIITARTKFIRPSTPSAPLGSASGAQSKP